MGRKRIGKWVLSVLLWFWTGGVYFFGEVIWKTSQGILGIPVYWHSLRHFFTTSLAKANLPDSIIKTIIGWESLEMVEIYKDIDDEEEIGKYFSDGKIIGQKQAALSDL